MSGEIDLRKLAELSADDRAFLSIYLSGPSSLDVVERRAKKIEKMLRDNSDESRHFAENMKLVDEYFDRHPFKSGSLCIFCCWLLDYFEVHELNVPVGDLIWVDSSPYIRPLAEFRDEYEDFAVVVADNKLSKIFLVTSGTAESEERVKGNVKNHVRVGGWSQQRYERRRDKELKHYCRDIVEKLLELDRAGEFRRIILVGSRETIGEIRKSLPDRLAKKLVGEKALELRKGGDYIDKEIFDLFFAEERKSEQVLWERIKSQYMRGGLAVAGAEDVLAAARTGRADRVVVNRDAKFAGIRCRDCEGLFCGKPDKCPDCGSTSGFEVDVVNEIVELLAMTGAEADFVDKIKELKDIGDIAALLLVNHNSSDRDRRGNSSAPRSVPASNPARDRRDHCVLSTA